MSDFDRDRFIFTLSREQLVKFREDVYMSYLYLRLQQIKGIDDSDVKTFLSFIEGKFDTLNDFNFNAPKTTIQNAIWSASNTFKDDWGYSMFKQKHRENQIDEINKK